MLYSTTKPKSQFHHRFRSPPSITNSNTQSKDQTTRPATSPIHSASSLVFWTESREPIDACIDCLKPISWNHNSKHLETRVALVDDRIYLWNIDRTPDDMLNVWGDRYFYLREEEYRSLLEELRQALHLTKNRSALARHLNKLIRSMISDDPFCQILRRDRKSRLLGDLLHLIRDSLELQNDYFEGIMTKVASRFGRAPIHNPKLPTGEKLSLIRSQLGAIVNSDCWLCNDGRMYYYEADFDRIKIVEKLFNQLGSFRLRLDSIKANRSFRMLLPRHIGKAFIYWGFATDDKAIGNRRLIRRIREGPRNLSIAYLQELIPEDGSFNDVSGFQWSRSIVLNPGYQDAKYNVTPKLNKQQISFISVNGRHDRKRGYIHLQLSEYLKIDDDQKPDIVKTIEDVIFENRCKLIDDEAYLAKKLGVNMRVYPECITLYEKTGRVSIKWVATTRKICDTINLFLIAPPNDIRKNAIVHYWITTRARKRNGGPGEIRTRDLLQFG